MKQYFLRLLAFAIMFNLLSCKSDDDSTEKINLKEKTEDENNFLSNLSSGDKHTLFINKKGELYGWGYNQSGELEGNETKISPKLINNGEWKSISCGYSSSIGIKKDGTLWGTGENGLGQLGINNTDNQSQFIQIGTENNWVEARLGYQHGIALKKDGTIWTWGSNQFFQLGKADDAPSLAPIQVGTENDWIHVFAGHNSSFAIKKDGSLWAWGYNYAGQLGIGSTSHTPNPTKIESDKKWKYISVGISFVAGIKEDGSLWTWGRNYFGELGNGLGDKTQNNNSSIPVKVESDKKWKKISLGKENAIALKEDNTLWIWGNNVFGKLGIGEKPDYNFFVNKPTKVNDETDWVDVSSGERFNIALKKDGSFWGWGSNRYYELGNDGDNQNSPIKIFQINE
ncbi:hypothetical protein KRX57_06080 [Weeksellaceae bacterium TAE3-ERU29]|nr:hypothetical protein [Weeksellaceae bacterium TAE3-ERU29]